MKKILTICFLLFAFNVNAMEKETTFKKELFDKAQSEGKVVVVSSWIKYCMSCASQMKVLQKAKMILKILNILHLMSPTKKLLIFLMYNIKPHF